MLAGGVWCLGVKDVLDCLDWPAGSDSYGGSW